MSSVFSQEHLFPRLQISRLEGRAQSFRLRQSLFHALHVSLTTSESVIKRAIAADSDGTQEDITLEYALALSELRAHYESLDLGTEVKLAHSPESSSGTTGVGIVYIVPSQRNIFYSTISPLCAAFAGGNCVIVEVCMRERGQPFSAWSD
jgi:aldehyde dehydrogenase (NAD+)